MKIECQNCSKEMSLTIQFLMKKTIEIECPHCHEVVIVQGESNQKQELGDTHPVLRVSEIIPDVPEKKIAKTHQRAKSVNLKYLAILLMFCVGALLIFFLRNLFSSTPPINLKNNDISPPKVSLEKETDLVIDEPVPFFKSSRKKKNAGALPLPREIPFTLPVSKINELSVSFQMAELSAIKPSILKLIDDGAVLNSDLGYKVAVLLTYLGVHEAQESYINKADALAALYPASVKNHDYNIYQSLKKIYQKDYSQATMFASAALQMNMRSMMAQALLRYAQYVSGRENTLGSLKALHQTKNFYPAGDFLFQIYVYEGKKSEAIIMARSLLRQHPEDISIKRLLAGIFFNSENYKDAATLYESLSKKSGARWEDDYSWARSLRRQKKLSEAKQVLNTLLQKTNLSISTEGSLLIQLERGWVEYDDRRYLEATRYFEVALQQNPRRKDTILALAESLIKSGRLTTAGQVLEKGREFYPSDPTILKPLFTFYIDQNRSPEALRLAEQMQVLKVADTQVLAWLESQKKPL